MSSQIQGGGAGQPSRRDFVRGAAAVGAAAIAAGSMPSFVHAAENNTIKIGLVGCGGRGGGAAVNALKADPNIKLIALADMFQDKLDAGLANLEKAANDPGSPIKGQVDVQPQMRLTGW